MMINVLAIGTICLIFLLFVWFAAHHLIWNKATKSVALYSLPIFIIMFLLLIHEAPTHPTYFRLLVLLLFISFIIFVLRVYYMIKKK